MDVEATDLSVSPEKNSQTTSPVTSNTLKMEYVEAQEKGHKKIFMSSPTK